MALSIDLTGRTALVTGSTQGIGLAIAARLAEAGARVVVNGRTQERVDEAVAQIEGDVVGVAADVATDDGVTTCSSRSRPSTSSSTTSASSTPSPRWRSATTSGAASSRSTSSAPYA